MSNQKNLGGRPPVPESERRRQVQFSLHPTTLAHLDTLSSTSNRSAWLTEAVDRAWSLRDAGLVAVTLTVAQVEALKALGFKWEGEGGGQ